MKKLSLLWKLSVLLLLTCAAVSCTESAEEKQKKQAEIHFIEGERLYSQLDYIDAAKNYQLAADLGHQMAQYKLGLCYEEGIGVQRNEFTAKNWYEKAAEQGNVEALCKVGQYYEDISNIEMAVIFYEKASEKGNSAAMYRLYLLNQKLDKWDRALEFLTLAANNNNPEACYAFALLYESGERIQKDFTKAVEYILKAAEQNYPQALYQLSLYYAEGNLLEYSPHLAADYMEKAANAGYLPAKYEYGCMLEARHLYQEAYEQFITVAQNGDPEAQLKVATFLMHGHLGEPNVNEGIIWLQKAALQNYIPAMYEYGCYFEKAEDYIMALQWYQKVVETTKGMENGHDLYRQTLGEVYYKIGMIKEKNSFEEAWEYFQQAAVYNHLESQFILGVNYYFGYDNFIEPDRKKAEEWFNKAIAGGHAFARSIKMSAIPNKDVVMKYIYAAYGNNNARYAYAQELLSGSNIPRDEEGAVSFLSLAAQEGHLDSIYQYAICLQEGMGVRPDAEKALLYLTQAADAKHIKSLYLLALWKSPGREVSAETLELMEKAANLGHIEAPIYLGDHYNRKDKALARYWYKIAAKSDNPKALQRLADLFDDIDDAKQYYQSRAEDEEPEAQAELAKLYFTGSTKSVVNNFENFIDKKYDSNLSQTDYVMGQYWLAKSIASNCAEAEFVMGLCNYFGWSMEENEANAESWFRKAAEKNHIDSMFAMGIMTLIGRGCSIDHDQARDWFMQGALHGHLESQRFLAACYENGTGGKEEYAAAKFWYKTLAAHGDSAAQQWLLIDASDPLIDTAEDLMEYGEDYDMKIDKYRELLEYTGSGVCNIPDGVQIINPAAFDNSTQVLHITVPDTVTSLDPNTFEYCYSLKSIMIPRDFELKSTPFGCKIVKY